MIGDWVRRLDAWLSGADSQGDLWLGLRWRTWGLVSIVSWVVLIPGVWAGTVWTWSSFAGRLAAYGRLGPKGWQWFAAVGAVGWAATAFIGMVLSLA